MLKTGEAGSIRQTYALRVWSAKQVRNRAAYRLWYVKHILRGEPELRLVAALCHPDRVMLDVGANRGMYAAAALRFSRGVIAFEPQSHLAAVMRKCLPEAVEIVECAVSESEGIADLQVPEDPRYHAEARIAAERAAPGASEQKWVTRSVRTVSLDDWVHRPVGLIKIDVEGHEMAVLRGAARIIGTWRPNIIIELEDRHGHGAFERARAWFAAIEYQAFWLDAGRLVPVLPDAVSRRSAGGHHVYNFVFLPIERSNPPRPSLRAALSAVLTL